LGSGNFDGSVEKGKQTRFYLSLGYEIDVKLTGKAEESDDNNSYLHLVGG
jgi:hypothetical protein